MKCWTVFFLAVVSVAAAAEPQSGLVDLKKVFTSAPIIYSALSLLSIASMVIWFYSLATVRAKEILPEKFIRELKSQLRNGQFKEAEELCQTQRKLLSLIVSAGLSSRKLGAQLMIDAMKSEGKRAGRNIRGVRRSAENDDHRAGDRGRHGTHQPRRRRGRRSSSRPS